MVGAHDHCVCVVVCGEHVKRRRATRNKGPPKEVRNGAALDMPQEGRADSLGNAGPKPIRCREKQRARTRGSRTG